MDIQRKRADVKFVFLLFRTLCFERYFKTGKVDFTLCGLLEKRKERIVQYIFKSADVWHVYEKIEDTWVYQRMQMVSEEVVKKEGEELPGPLGRLDRVQELEQQLKQEQIYAKQQEQLRKQQEQKMQQQQKEFEKSYKELQKLAEDMQEEGRLWRQRYLDLAYQISPKGK